MIKKYLSFFVLFFVVITLAACDETEGETTTTLGLNDAEIVTQAKEDLTVPDSITGALDIPFTIGDVTVEWTSNNLDIISFDNANETVTVTQPAFGEENATVELTAYLTLNSETDSKTFTVIVEAEEAVVSTIADARALAINETVTIQGIVTGVIGNNIFIQDDTAGIYIYVGGDTEDDFVLGNELKISGKRAEYSGLIQLNNIISVTKVSEGNTLPTPQSFSTIDALISANVGGELVTLENLEITELPNDLTFGGNIVVTDGIDQIILRIDRWLEPTIDISILSVGDVINVTGLVGNFHGIQIMLRSDDDITIPEQLVAQGVTDTTIIVGNTAATSGPFSEVGGPFNEGIKAYFAMVNENGGIAGRTIEFKHYDDGFDASQGQTYTQQLVEVDEVFALVGHFGTPTVGSTLDYLNEIGIPRVYYATGISDLYNPSAEDGERASFPVQPIYDAEGEVMVARAVANLGASKIGVIYSNDNTGLGTLNGIQIKASEMNIPLTIAQVASHETDMSVAAQTMLSAGVDVILIAANQEPSETAVKALNDAGNTVPVITSYVNASPIWLSNVSNALNNFDIYASSWINAFANDSADITLFVDEISKIKPEYAANAYAFAGWIAAAAFVEGLERVGEDTLTWENYINAMEESLVELPFGVVVDYSNDRRVGTQAMSFLKGTYNTEKGMYEFVTEQPIQTITDILGE